MLRSILRKALAVNVRQASSVAQKERWDLCVGVLIERLPVVSKKFNEIENDLMKTLSRIEFENSLKSDHELRKEKDKIQQELIRTGKIDIELDADARSMQTAQDFEDLNQEELAKFKFAPRETEADKINDLKSLDRKLDDTLMLVCAENIGNKDAFLLPQALRIDGESLRQTAERIVKEKFGTELKVHFYGNAPCGFYKYKYKPSEKQDAVGVKTFFYRAAYKSGEVKDKTVKFEWVNEAELRGKVRESYYQSVSQFLIS